MNPEPSDDDLVLLRRVASGETVQMTAAQWANLAPRLDDEISKLRHEVVDGVLDEIERHMKVLDVIAPDVAARLRSVGDDSASPRWED